MDNDEPKQVELVRIFMTEYGVGFEIPPGTNMQAVLGALASTLEQVRYLYTRARLQAEVQEQQKQDVVAQLIQRGRRG